VRQTCQRAEQRQRRSGADVRQQFVARGIDAVDRAFDLPDRARPRIAAGVPGRARRVVRLEVAAERALRRRRTEQRERDRDRDQRAG
jgi:hypothetical protein